MPDAVMFSSTSTEWGTPPVIYTPLDDRFDFTYDPAASHVNAKCALYSTVDGTYAASAARSGHTRLPRTPGKADGLEQWWWQMAPEGERARCFVNPPYGRGAEGTLPWVRKARLEAAHGALVVMLLAARTDTAWFHDYVQGSAEITFVRGRISFDRTADCCAHHEDAHDTRPGGGSPFCLPCELDAGTPPLVRAARHAYARIGESVGAPFPSMVAVYR